MMATIELSEMLVGNKTMAMMLLGNISQRRWLHVTKINLKSKVKRPTSWTLPDLDKLPNGFRGKVYNNINEDEYLTKDKDILEENHIINNLNNNKKQDTKIKLPPPGWRKNKNLPQWLRNKYALKEKSMKLDLSKVKKLSPNTSRAIRALHDQFPNELPNEKLAEFFNVSPVAIAKILKSRWTPTEKELSKLEARWERRVSKQITEKMVENKFTEFIQETERKLKMEIPLFFKNELHAYYLKHGIENVQKDFDELNEARIEREKIKDGKISNYVNSVVKTDTNKNQD